MIATAINQIRRSGHVIRITNLASVRSVDYEILFSRLLLILYRVYRLESVKLVDEFSSCAFGIFLFNYIFVFPFKKH